MHVGQILTVGLAYSMYEYLEPANNGTIASVHSLFSLPTDVAHAL